MSERTISARCYYAAPSCGIRAVDSAGARPRLRVALYAPHFAEYATRMAMGLAREADVLLFLEQHNCRDECTPVLLADARRAVRVVTFDAWGAVNYKLSMLRILGTINLFRPDVVHIQEQADLPPMSVVGRLGRQRKMVLTVHDPEPHSGRDSLGASQMAAKRHTVRQRADAFHVHGEFCRNAMLAAGWRDKPIVSTSHGIILEPRPEQRTESEPGRILMFGRMEAYKGVDVLIEAAAMMRSRGAKFRLVFAGRGPELERAQRAAENCGDIELIEKFLSPDEAVLQFQRARVVAAPYLDATQSGVVAAAMANGRPVVASRVGGLIDAVADGKNGLLVEPGDAAALAGALMQLLRDDDLRQRLTTGAHHSAAGELDWGRIGATLLETYRTLHA